MDSVRSGGEKKARAAPKAVGRAYRGLPKSEQVLRSVQ